MKKSCSGICLNTENGSYFYLYVELNNLFIWWTMGHNSSSFRLYQKSIIYNLKWSFSDFSAWNHSSFVWSVISLNPLLHISFLHPRFSSSVSGKSVHMTKFTRVSVLPRLQDVILHDDCGMKEPPQRTDAINPFMRIRQDLDEPASESTRKNCPD